MEGEWDMEKISLFNYVNFRVYLLLKPEVVLLYMCVLSCHLELAGKSYAS